MGGSTRPAEAHVVVSRYIFNSHAAGPHGSSATQSQHPPPTAIGPWSAPPPLYAQKQEDHGAQWRLFGSRSYKNKAVILAHTPPFYICDAWPFEVAWQFTINTISFVHCALLFSSAWLEAFIPFVPLHDWSVRMVISWLQFSIFFFAFCTGEVGALADAITCQSSRS